MPIKVVLKNAGINFERIILEHFRFNIKMLLSLK
jgi:hypothetical protein